MNPKFLAQYNIDLRKYRAYEVRKALLNGSLTPWSLPRTTEGSPIPAFYGTVRIDKPALIWWGNPAYGFSHYGGIWTYSVDLIYALGTPAYGVTSTLIGARWGDKLVERGGGGYGITRWSLTDGQGMEWWVHLQGTFGSNLAPANFVHGVLQYYGGSPTQNVTVYPASPPIAPGANGATYPSPPSTLYPSYFYQLLDNMLVDAGANNSSGISIDRSICPGWRNTCLVAMRVWLSPSSTLPSVSFDIASPGPQGIFVQNGTDANPARVLLDLLTGPIYKTGVPSQYVDTNSFLACATTLANEGNGCSVVIDSSTDVTQVVDSLVQQIDGHVYQSTSTGLITLRLIRNDWVSVPALPQITQNNVIGSPDYTTTTPRESYNAVRATYQDRAQSYQQGAIIGEKLGMLSAQDNRMRQLSVDYPHVKSATLAAQLAQFDLNAVARPLAQLKCDVQRFLFNAAIGDPVAATLPQYGVSQKVMRIVSIDLGQLADEKIHLELVEDVRITAVGSLGGGTYTIFIPTVSPLTKRMLFEAPRWWTAQQIAAGKAGQSIATPDMPTSFSVATPDDGATIYAVQTRTLPTPLGQVVVGTIASSPDYPLILGQIGPGAQYASDIGSHLFPASCTLVNAYGRQYEPYDTTSGLLVVQGLTGTLAGIDLSAQTWTTDGSTMLMIVEPSGLYEFVLFESATNLGGGQFRLNNVWRGLIDTPAIAHAAGSIAYFIGSPASVGTIAYAVGKTVQGQSIPRQIPGVGSGKDPIDSYKVAGRAVSPYPPADWRVGSDYPNIVGTAGVPTLGDGFKIITRLEEGYYGAARTRDRRVQTTVTRGDAAPETTSDDSVTYQGGVVVATGVALPAVGFTAYGPIEPGLNATAQNHTNAQVLGVGGQVMGYGQFDIVMFTQKAIASGDPLYSLLGLKVGTIFYSPNPVRVPAFLPSWRNLLMNARWNYWNGTATPSDQGWDNSANNVGTASFGTGFGAAPYNNAIQAASGTQLVREQAVKLTQFTGGGAFVGGPQSYLPRGLAAIACGYFADNSGSTDTGGITVEALDVNQTSLGSHGATIALTTAFWTYQEMLYTGGLPSGAVFVRVDITCNRTVGNGAANNENALYIGQFASNTTKLLANDSWDSALTSWTVDSGTITAAVAAELSAGCASMTGTVTAQMHQDLTLPTGYEYCTAVVRVWFDQTVAANHPDVQLQMLDGSNNVLASADLGFPAQTLNAWLKQTLSLDSVDGTVKVRVIIAGSYNSGASVGVKVDECRFMLHKRLDAAYATSLTFDTPTYQPMPATWQDYHLAYPTMPRPTVYGGNPNDGFVEWSDGGSRNAVNIVGLFGAASGTPVTSIPAYPITRTSPGSLIYLQPIAASNVQNTQIGSYSLAQSFTALCYFRVDEPGFNTFCGLVGRMNAFRGWGINITAGGQLEALLRGNSNTSVSIASGRVVSEGALHMAAIVYNAATSTLSIYDEQGLGASISTATIQDFASLPIDLDAFLRIGTDAPDHQTLPGQIGPLYLWSQALTTTQIASQWNYCKDPTGFITTYTRTAGAIVPIGPDANGNAQACVMSAAQVALAYNSVLTNDNGSAFVVTSQGTGWQLAGANPYTATGYGLAVGKSTTNLIQDALFTGANWAIDGLTVLTQSQTDPTGRARGVLVAGDASDGISALNVPLAASPANVTLVFWAMQTAGGTSLDIQLQNSSGVVKNTQNVTLTSKWQQFAVTFSGWDGSTATAKIRWVSHTGSLSFVLAGIMCAAQGTDIPAILPLPGQTHGNYNAQVATTLPKQFNYEGELIAEGVAMIASPTPAAATLVQATNGTTANQRELQVLSGSSGFRSQHYDSTGTSVTATSAYSTYASQIWRARCRWAQCGMLDNVSPQDFSAVAWTDDAHSTPTVVSGRTASWTITAVAPTTINIGAGTASPSDVILRKVIVRSREEKLI